VEINNLLETGRKTNLIPIFETKHEADYFAAKVCQMNEHLHDVCIINISSLLNDGKAELTRYTKNATQTKRKGFFSFLKFWS